MTNRVSMELAGVVVGCLALLVTLLGWQDPARHGETGAGLTEKEPGMAERVDRSGEVTEEIRRGKEEGALALTAAMVEALPSPLVGLGPEQDPEAGAAVVAELARVEQILKERRKEAIRGQRIGVGRTLRFPAQTDRELAALVSGMRLPESVSGDQAEVVRTMAIAKFAKEYGVVRTVTPMLRESILIGGGMRQSFVEYRETVDGALATQWANRCQPGISALDWKFDFLVTPELVALDAEAKELCYRKVVAGGDRTEAGEEVCRELTEREGRN